MAMFIDKSLIGGMSGVFNPLALANNPQMGDLYEASKPLNTILYMDANNLYGWAIGQCLPAEGFKWVDISTKENWTDFILKQKD